MAVLASILPCLMISEPALAVLRSAPAHKLETLEEGQMPIHANDFAHAVLETEYWQDDDRIQSKRATDNLSGDKAAFQCANGEIDRRKDKGVSHAIESQGGASRHAD